MLHIGVVLPYLKAGGTERQAIYICRHLQDQGYRVTLIVSEEEGAFSGNEEVSTFPLGIPFKAYNAPRIVLGINKAISEFGIDVIVSRAWNTNMIAALGALLAWVPYVVFLSGATDRRDKWKVRLWCEQLLLRHAGRIISVSEGAMRNCMRSYNLCEGHISVVHNGIDIQEVTQLAKASSDVINEGIAQGFSIVFVGSLNYRKGFDIILKALSVMDELAGITVWVVGGGEIKRYQQMSEAYGLHNIVTFLGERANPYPVMSKADLLVLPSRSEGFPNVLLEGMALGLPVIASDCETGPREIIDGCNGLLFEVEDHLGLARAIRQFMKDEPRRKRVGEFARSTVEARFELKVQLSKLENIIVDVVSG